MIFNFCNFNAGANLINEVIIILIIVGVLINKREKGKHGVIFNEINNLLRLPWLK